MNVFKKSLLSVSAAIVLCSATIYAKEVNDPAREMVEKYGEVGSLENQAFINSEDQANEYLEKMGERHPKLDSLSTGWNEELNAYIAIGTATFKIANPKTDKSFITKRELKSISAMLSAKAEIIEYINTEMSVEDKVDVPGTDLEKKFGAKKEALREQYENVKTQLNKYKKYLDVAEQDKLEGITFGDYAKAGFASLMKKIDASITKENLEAQELATYNKIKATYDKTSAELKDLEQQISAFEDIAETIKGSVDSLSKMPLFGSTAIAQFESWDKSTGEFSTSIVMIWSKKMERAARAFITGEDYTVKTRQTKSISKWIKSQDWSTSTGVRKFVDKNGITHFIGISAIPIRGTSSIAKKKAKGVSELFAKKNAAVSVFADIESQRTAEAMMETYSDGEDYEESAAMESYSENLKQSFKNRKINGASKRYGKVLVHPISQQKMYVSIYSIDQKGAKKALEIQERNYLNKMIDVVSQKKLKQKEKELKKGVDDAYNVDLTQTNNEPQRTNNYQSKEIEPKVVKKAPKQSKSYAGAGNSDDFEW